MAEPPNFSDLPRSPGGMRAWEPMEGEVTNRNKGKPWHAFKIYRDLGPRRTLKQAAAGYWGVAEEVLTDTQYKQIRKWSAQFDWGARAQALDDAETMREQATIEEYLDTKRADYAERRARLQEGSLEVAEKALDQARKMVEWPLAEQRVFREGAGEDGEDVTYVFMPSGWSKATVVSMMNIVAGGIAGNWANMKVEPEEDMEFDFSDMSEEELQEFISLQQRVKVKPKDR